MKQISTLCLIAIAIVGFFGLTAFKPLTKTSSIYVGEYNAQLISHQPTGGNYEWVWTVTNPNPGNGSNGTMQNLSHWSLAISDMVTDNDLVQVAYSTDGITWTDLPAHFAIDKSQECYTGTVLKFDYGTTGGAPTYYKLVVDKDFSEGLSTANFKSGSKTGCYNSIVTGIGEDPDGSNGR
ncbi:MAG: hypothetical protein ACJ749_08305 [Flavisolibacter sp.]